MNPATGPESIEGYYDEARRVPGLLAEIAKGEARAVDGHVIACFDDTGLDAARALASAPVVGIGEAGFHAASLIAGTFWVVTTLARAIPAIQHNLVRYGLATRCARVRAVEVAVLALEDPARRTRARVSTPRSRRRSVRTARRRSCSAARGWRTTPPISQRGALPVVDGVTAAVVLVEALVRLGLTTSKLGGYASPLPKRIV